MGADIKSLDALEDKTITLTNLIETLSQQKKVGEFFETFNQLDTIKAKAHSLEYLTKISDDMIYQNYFNHWSLVTDSIEQSPLNISQRDKIKGFLMRYNREQRD